MLRAFVAGCIIAGSFDPAFAQSTSVMRSAVIETLTSARCATMYRVSHVEISTSGPAAGRVNGSVWLVAQGRSADHGTCIQTAQRTSAFGEPQIIRWVAHDIRERERDLAEAQRIHARAQLATLAPPPVLPDGGRDYSHYNSHLQQEPTILDPEPIIVNFSGRMVQREGNWAVTFETLRLAGGGPWYW